MSDQSSFDPEDYEGIQPKQSAISNAELRVLRKQAAKVAELEAQMAQRDRQDLFTEAGVQRGHPAASFFIKGYEGDLTPEAIRAEWEKINPAADPGVQQAYDQQLAQDLAGHRAAIDAASGANAASSQPDVAAELNAIRLEAEGKGGKWMADNREVLAKKTGRLMHERGYEVEVQKRRSRA